MFWLDSCEPAILCRLGFKWNVWYVCDEMLRNAEDEEEDAMKMKNISESFGCLICVRSEK